MTGERVARHAEAARADWVERIAERRDEERVAAVSLDAPAGLRASGGRAQVTLDWDAVAGAAGYLVYRAPSADGPFAVVDFGSNDVLAVPHPPFTDTTGDDDDERWYSVAAVADIATIGPRADAVAARPDRDGSATVTVAVDASSVSGAVARPWRPMIGSEHLSHLLCADTSGGRPIGRELAEALRICRDELGVETVRAHAILGDDLGTYREVDGRPCPRLQRDRPRLRPLARARPAAGGRAVVHAPRPRRDPSKTVFAYGAIVSPPKDWDRWGDLVSDLTASPRRALRRRRGARALELRGVERAQPGGVLERHAGGVHAAVRRLRACGPRCRRPPRRRWAGRRRPPAGWTSGSATSTPPGAPVDFVSTHTYGAPPLDLRPLLDRHGRRDTDLVDGVGCHADALQPRRRRGVRRGVPAPRDALGRRPHRRPVALGGVGPLRGARPPLVAPARWLRPAVRRQPAQAAVPRAAAAGAPRRRGAGDQSRRRRCGRHGRGMGRPRRRGHGSAWSCGTARSTSRGPPAIRRSIGGSS